MLFERIAELNRKLVDLQAIRDSRHEIDRLLNRRDELTSAVAPIVAEARRVASFRRHEVDVGFEKNKVRALHAKVCVYLADVDGFTRPGADIRHQFLERLPEVRTELVTALNDAWRGVLGKAPPDDEALLAMYEAVRETSKAVAQFRKANAALSRHRYKVPDDLDALDTAFSNLAKLSKAWQAMQEANLPQDVKSFIQRANGGEATVADLTDSVLDWLRSTHPEMLRSLRIRLSR
jgi:hypothetical protein